MEMQYIDSTRGPVDLTRIASLTLFIPGFCAGVVPGVPFTAQTLYRLLKKNYAIFVICTKNKTICGT